MQFLETVTTNIVNFLWGNFLMYLILFSGAYFLIKSKFIPFRYLGHAFKILFGKYDSKEDPGIITHFQALCTALSGTIGMGNLSGVAVAISTGGPGAIFWMWISAVVGMGIKFFTCSLAIMYRKEDGDGQLIGGPMVVIDQALPKTFKPLAYLFTIAGLFGSLTLFQINQLTQIVSEKIIEPFHIFGPSIWQGKLIFGIFSAIIIGQIIAGKLKRIAKVASLLVPIMVLVFAALSVLSFLSAPTKIIQSISIILKDAFTGHAILGGNLGLLMAIGFKRAAFSNEAGTGTESMAHAMAKTKEPIREGLVAMLGPFIDTLIVCTLTACLILSTPLWQPAYGLNGISLTFAAFESYFGAFSTWILLIVLISFALSTMVAYYYYFYSCARYLFGKNFDPLILATYLLATVAGSVLSLTLVVNIIDIGFALMAIPTTVSALLLSSKVMQTAKVYFKKQKGSF